MNSEKLLSCKNAVICYDNTVAVNDVTFDLFRGDYLCIVGENGSGKSTLLKGILGLLPLKSGCVEFAPSLRRTDIGYLPQQTREQRDFPATVGEIVMSGFAGKCGYRPFYSAAQRADARTRKS